jgi:hypothetical protein
VCRQLYGIVGVTREKEDYFSSDIFEVLNEKSIDSTWRISWFISSNQELQSRQEFSRSSKTHLALNKLSSTFFPPLSQVTHNQQRSFLPQLSNLQSTPTIQMEKYTKEFAAEIIQNSPIINP